jgi:hypothetical protein
VRWAVGPALASLAAVDRGWVHRAPSTDAFTRVHTPVGMSAVQVGQPARGETAPSVACPARPVRHGLYRYGLSRYGLSPYGLSRHGLSRHGLSRYGLSRRDAPPFVARKISGQYFGPTNASGRVTGSLSAIEMLLRLDHLHSMPSRSSASVKRPMMSADSLVKK